MPDAPKLNDPWLVAVWPGMGHVAITAGYYLMAKLQMFELSEFPSGEIFDVEQVEVREGLVRAARLPRNRFFVWPDSARKRDILLFIGEAQPTIGKYAFCHRLLEYAEKLGVKRVFTFAAMVTNMHPDAESRVYGVATDVPGVEEVRGLGASLMDQGQIAGLNGVLLAATAERNMRGTGLLGEMPGYAPQIPFPKASLAVLSIFSRMAGIQIDFRDLSEYGKTMQKQLSDLLEKMQQAIRTRMEDPEGGLQDPFAESLSAGGGEEEGSESGLSDEDRRRIEEMFQEAAVDRSRTFELKKELDRLGVFKDFEDRFLDLFRKQG